MDNTQSTRGHNLSLANRKHGLLTGVKEVISFDTDMVVLATEQGKLTIKGEELHVSKLDVDKGELELSGKVDSLVYSELRTPGQVASGVLGRLFK